MGATDVDCTNMPCINMLSCVQNWFDYSRISLNNERIKNAFETRFAFR